MLRYMGETDTRKRHAAAKRVAAARSCTQQSTLGGVEMRMMAWMKSVLQITPNGFYSVRFACENCGYQNWHNLKCGVSADKLLACPKCKCIAFAKDGWYF